MNDQSTLSFQPIPKSDIPELTVAMPRAFDDDAQGHHGLECGGPEGHDDLEFSCLGTVFVDPAYQDQGCRLAHLAVHRAVVPPGA